MYNMQLTHQVEFIKCFSVADVYGLIKLQKVTPLNAWSNLFTIRLFTWFELEMHLEPFYLSRELGIPKSIT